MGKCKRWFDAVSNVVILLTYVVPNTGLMQDENVPDFLKVEAAFSNVQGSNRNNEAGFNYLVLVFLQRFGTFHCGKEDLEVRSHNIKENYR
jgi:hypothetical protein